LGEKGTIHDRPRNQFLSLAFILSHLNARLYPTP
jgi:hypothetical protein